jgi:hypothetical protein
VVSLCSGERSRGLTQTKYNGKGNCSLVTGKATDAWDSGGYSTKAHDIHREMDILSERAYKISSILLYEFSFIKVLKKIAGFQTSLQFVFRSAKREGGVDFLLVPPRLFPSPRAPFLFTSRATTP